MLLRDGGLSLKHIQMFSFFFVEQEMEDRWDTKIEATEEEESNITLLALVIVEIE